jgi:hypothetical protein
MDEDGPLHMEGRQMGNPEHTIGKEGCGSRASANRIPRSDSSGHLTPQTIDFYGISLHRGRRCLGFA